MDGETVNAIRRMQSDIDSFSYFANNLLLKLQYPDKEVLSIDTGDDICNAIWEEVDKLQKK